MALCFVEYLPARGNQDEATADESEAQKVERPKMRVGSPAEHLLKKVPSVVGEPIDARKTALQPAREQIDRQWEPVHLGEQRNQKGAKGAEGAPVALRLRLEEGEGEEDENHRIDDYQRPKAIGGNIVVHSRPPDS